MRYVRTVLRANPRFDRNWDDPIEISIEPVKNYEKLARHLRVLKTINGTCEMVRNIALDGNAERLERAIENLCYLLSVAPGTKFQWIYCDQYSEEGILFSRRHGTRVTKVYCSLYILDQNNHRETKAFIEGTYSSDVANCNRYEFDGGTIDAYLDAKAENDYLELRDIKLAVAMEALKAVFLKQPDFRKRLKTRRASFKAVLIRLFDSMMLSKPPHPFNDRHYSRDLSLLCPRANEKQLHLPDGCLLLFQV